MRMILLGLESLALVPWPLRSKARRCEEMDEVFSFVATNSSKFLRRERRERHPESSSSSYYMT
jgi:hypothetical protein